jgi:hypothetical protein
MPEKQAIAKLLGMLQAQKSLMSEFVRIYLGDRPMHIMKIRGP